MAGESNITCSLQVTPAVQNVINHFPEPLASNPKRLSQAFINALETAYLKFYTNYNTTGLLSSSVSKRWIVSEIMACNKFITRREASQMAEAIRAANPFEDAEEQEKKQSCCGLYLAAAWEKPWFLPQ